MRIDKIQLAIELAEQTKDVKTLSKIGNELCDLIILVDKIPHYCGKKDCQNEACKTLNMIRDLVIDLINRHGKSPY